MAGGEHDAPLPTGKPSLGETSEPTGQHLYLIFDDWPWGYSIRKLELPPRCPPHQPEEHKRLPPPCICLEATRRQPLLFAAVGTSIIAAHRRNDFWNAPVPECILPIVDVRSLGLRFGPGLSHSAQPILITAGADDEAVFALDMGSFMMLSMKPLCPPHEWSWQDLPPPPLNSMDVTSLALGSDGRTIFASSDRATFAFDTVSSEWRRSSDCSLPFAGPANYVRVLDVFVGLSKDPDTYGHLCFCRELGGGDGNVVRLSKENLLSKDPAESHAGATLVYLGGGSEPPGFCLVECVSITQGKSANMRLEECVDEGGGNCDQLNKNVDEASGSSMHECGELDELNKNVDEGDGSMHDRYIYLYRLTTFSLSFDKNGDLTTGETCVVQCYEVPEEVSEAIYLVNPVAFWL